jgi:uncharacterized membrane protein required for colicin V production
MSAAKIVGAVLGLILGVGGFLGVAVSVFAIFDPAGTQMADDANPFGPPPSLLRSLAILVFYLGVCAIGFFLTWRAIRKASMSA